MPGVVPVLEPRVPHLGKAGCPQVPLGQQEPHRGKRWGAGGSYQEDEPLPLPRSQNTIGQSGHQAASFLTHVPNLLASSQRHFSCPKFFTSVAFFQIITSRLFFSLFLQGEEVREEGRERNIRARAKHLSAATCTRPDQIAPAWTGDCTCRDRELHLPGPGITHTQTGDGTCRTGDRTRQCCDRGSNLKSFGYGKTFLLSQKSARASLLS